MSDELDFDPPIPKTPEAYKEVDDQHIVTKHWLKRFSGDQKQIQRFLVAKGWSEKRSIKSVATWDQIYSRTRPRDGSRIDDMEWSMHLLETASARPLREIENNWPLSFEHKATLAQFFALHMVRGPRWFKWREEFGLATLCEYRARGEFKPGPGETRSEEELYADAKRWYLSDTERLLRMNAVSATAASVLGSMTWTLLRFPKPWLAISDHPISIWSVRESAKNPAPTFAGEIGVTNMLEVRVPLAPDLALLMSWSDRPNDLAPVEGKKHHAKNLNAATVAQAEKEWFWHPDYPRPQMASGRLLPLTPELVEGYSSSQALNSAYRVEIYRRLEAKKGQGTEALDEHGRHISEMIYEPARRHEFGLR